MQVSYYDSSIYRRFDIPTRNVLDAHRAVRSSRNHARSAVRSTRPGTLDPGGAKHVVMADERLALEQKLVVFGVVPRALVVVTGKRANRIERVPEREQEKVRHVAIGAPQNVDAAVARCLHIVRQSSALEIPVVRVRLLGRHAAVPGAPDHDSPSCQSLGSQRCGHSAIAMRTSGTTTAPGSVASMRSTSPNPSAR